MKILKVRQVQTNHKDQKTDEETEKKVHDWQIVLNIQNI